MASYLFFFCRARRRVKLLLWDEDGYALYHKRLEAGTYEMPEGTSLHQPISAEQLNLLLSGVHLKNIVYRVRYQKHISHHASML